MGKRRYDAFGSIARHGLAPPPDLTFDPTGSFLVLTAVLQLRPPANTRPTAAVAMVGGAKKPRGGRKTEKKGPPTSLAVYSLSKRARAAPKSH